MDLKGQLQVEQIYQWLLILVGVVAFLVGYLMQSFRMTVYIVGAGTALTAAVCLPDWPFFNKHPIDFATPKRKKPVVQKQ